MPSSPAIPEVRRPMEVAPAEVQTISGGLLEVIARAARDPSVDIDKMERLLEMQERVLARHAQEAYAVALAEMQPGLPVISERGKILNRNNEVQSTYARWEDVNEAIRPLLAEHGFSLSFRTGREGSDITVTGVLTHRQGHSEETTITLPSDGSGSKNAVQAVGSSTSYGKRYTAFALLNITSKGEDDDGESATKYQASGEPMPRAKLDGPHASKTALRTAVHAMIAAVRAAQSGEEIDRILKEGKDTRKQAERDWPALINGDPQMPEDVGLKGAVEAQRAAVADDGMLKAMIGSMKENGTLQALANWMDANEEAVSALDGAESRTFQLAYDMHESALKLAGTVAAG
jgi:hypothetical protein